MMNQQRTTCQGVNLPGVVSFLTRTLRARPMVNGHGSELWRVSCGGAVAAPILSKKVLVVS